ncbi:MAG TPA: hypothetical protein VK181_23385 [Rhizobium sp.]|nr:hypothetical protein [Rhizobium sp.]
MDFPDFFADAPAISLRDPLAVFLGASKLGVMTYTYADAVKLAGHSCPTVASAYLMVWRGLKHLYGDDIPDRGGLEVHLRDPRDHGTTGVIASVATLLTGAAPETGFGGIGPAQRFARRDLLRFDAPITTVMGLRRLDNGSGVLLDVDTSVVPPARVMQQLFPRVLAEQAEDVERAQFAELWQSRVEKMLIEHAEDPALVRIKEWDAAA